MEFSVTVPEEWLMRRRSQVAEASRKIRAKKKREEEELREENAKLREERSALLNKITELEKSISELTDRDEDLENELLRTQLEQHKGFLKGFLETIADLEPKEESSKGELSRQNRDFAMMHALRYISESQQNRKNEWKTVRLLDPEFSLPGNADYSVLYSRPSPGTLHIRCDLVIPKIPAKAFRDTVARYWHDIDVFQSIFGKDKMMTATELPEFSVDDPEKGEKLRAFHCREPAGAKFQETAFLTAIGETILSKSTLQLPPGRGPVLSQSISNQEVGTVGHKRAKRMSDPVEWGICGTATVYYGLRTVTGHGLNSLVNEEENVQRMMSTGVESFMAWEEEIESIDPKLAGPCCRCVEFLTLPPHFRFAAIGGIDDFVDPSGGASKEFTDAVRNFIALGLTLVKGTSQGATSPTTTSLTTDLDDDKSTSHRS